MPKITLRAARVNAGLTQREAAKKLGINYQTLAAYEKDESKATLSMIKKMCSIYGFPLEYIFLQK